MRNCFICYRHDRDQEYLEVIRKLYAGQNLFDYSLKEDIGHLTDEIIYGHIRNKLYRCSVTIVLIGNSTGHRKWTDWELWASLRKYTHPWDSRKTLFRMDL